MVNNFNADNPEKRKAILQRYRKSVKGNRNHFIKQLIRTARNNAVKRKLPFNLTYDLISTWIIIQGEKCILTGFPFDYNQTDYRTRPFAPSIDRKDNSLGYTYDNIQIVCCIVNRAKNEFTQQLFDEMCLARVRTMAHAQT